jgi:hypothetical protein
MSVETTTYTNKNTSNVKNKTWIDEWDIEPYGYTTNIDERFFSEDSPHEKPLIDVDVKLAADIEIRDDSKLVQSVAEHWFPHDTERYVEVAEITFNDVSVWYLPLAPWDKDYENTRLSIVDDFVSDIVQWNAVVNNESPKVALEEWHNWLEQHENNEWTELMSETEMDESQRKWFNENADWLPHIPKTVESKVEDIEFDGSNKMNWEDNW